MFPMEFEYRVLESLPLPEKEGIDRVCKILNAIIHRRVLPFFRKRGTEPGVIARSAEMYHIERLEDEDKRLQAVSVLSRTDRIWTIHIHERVFDYLAFLIPSDPDSRLGGVQREEGKMLAFAEFLLRHEMEHLLHPEKTEREVVHSDVSFAMERRADDPTFYRMLRNALADEMTGLKGQPYLNLFNAAEQEQPCDEQVTQILSGHAAGLAGAPEDLLRKIFVVADADMRLRLLGEHYRRSRDTTYSLMQRFASLRKVLRLFALLIEHDEAAAEKIFHSFGKRWGLVSLFHEIDLSERSLEGMDRKKSFVLFRETLNKLLRERALPSSSFPAPRYPPPREVPAEPTPVKSLKDRIEEARNDPAFPRHALEVIDKNKVSAVGHSGPKYTELIETLLAIPWGRLHRIVVSPEAFEEGLDRTHYGLHKPKEIVCDFFTNLIWRSQRTVVHGGPLERTGSAFLFVGPPGVGKTSLAISIARNLGIPYHKISLGGMRDEADLRGHGFTYEGSKPGAILQGLIKMGVMNGMFIMDEADKTEKFAIATLLEILDPEQNHLFHDKYTQTTVDIDLSNCHFVLTANTLETVPPAVMNRCEVVVLDRYSVEEKVAIAKQHLIHRVREKYQIDKRDVFFEPDQETDLLRHLIKTYTYEPGVRELERIIRTLFLRILRKEILLKEAHGVCITRAKIKQHLESPRRPWEINEEDRVGEMLALGVNLERGIGAIIPIQATPIRLVIEGEGRPQGYMSMIHATGNIEKVMDESRKVATTGILHCAEKLGISIDHIGTPVHLHFMGGSTPKDGPSAGGAIALALASALSGRKIRRDVAMTGEIDTHGRITLVGGLGVKLETACDAGCKTLIVPRDNLSGTEGIERLPEALKKEIQLLTYPEWKGAHPPFDYEQHALQVVAVDHVVQAADIAMIDEEEIASIERHFIPHAQSVAERFSGPGKEDPPCTRLIYAKDQNELDLEGIPDRDWRKCDSLVLAGKDFRKSLSDKIPLIEKGARFVDFDPARTAIASTLREVQKHAEPVPQVNSQLSLIAPFFFLIREGLPSRELRGVRLFANNYALQRVKIKTCKPVLNRVHFHLAVMGPSELARCPFLALHEGIYVADLSFIPEKYRLDVRRAEKILENSLRNWLAVMEHSLQPDERRST